MANFHLELKHHSKKTKSVESVIAYRARGKISNFDYSKKRDLIEIYNLFPEEFRESDIINRMSLNEGFCEIINEVEKRRDSQICDEIIISLQHELTLEENKRLLNQLLNEFYIENEKRFAKVFIHNPNDSNLHAHVILTQRPLEKAQNGEIRLGKKFRQEFVRGKPKNAENVVLMRSRWASLCNNAFYKIGLKLEITHKSLKTQKDEALKGKNYELASQLERSSSYIPLNVLSSGFAVNKHHTLSFDFQTNSRLQELFRNRRKIKKCDMNKVWEESQLVEELESRNLFRKASLSLIKKYQRISLKTSRKENELDSATSKKITPVERRCFNFKSNKHELKLKFKPRKKRIYSFN